MSDLLDLITDVHVFVLVKKLEKKLRKLKNNVLNEQQLRIGQQ